MPKFQVSFGDNEPFVAGPDDGEIFHITVQDGFSIDPEYPPRISVGTQSGEEGEKILTKTWLDETILETTPISIRLVSNMETDDPAEVLEKPWPEPICSFCLKQSSEVEFLVEAPNKFSAICNDCTDVCAAEIDKRRNERQTP